MHITNKKGLTNFVVGRFPRPIEEKLYPKGRKKKEKKRGRDKETEGERGTMEMIKREREE